MSDATGKGRLPGGNTNQTMGRSWSGFVAQNELAKLQWELLEACEVEPLAQALAEFARSSQLRTAESDEEDLPDLPGTEPRGQ